MAFAVTFELTGVGWMDIHLHADGRRHLLDGLSYFTPVLDDVVRAAIHVATGTKRADVVFERESEPPLRLRFEKRWFEDSREFEHVVEVARDPSYLFFQEGSVPESDFEHLWEARVESGDEIAKAVLAAAKALEAERGHDGYGKEWAEHAFPVRAVAALEAALAIEPLPPPPND